VKAANLAEFVFIALAAAGVYGFVTAARDGETRRACTSLCAMRPDYAGRNRLAPDFELPSITGQKVSLSSYRGKTVIMNFWTKTCRPCLEEMPAIAALAKALKAHPDIALITISTDESAEDARDTMKSVLGGSEPPFIVLLDPEAKIVTDKYGTKLFPETWFIDKKGVIRARFDGVRDWASALTVDMAKSLSTPIPCEVQFAKGRPEGEWAGVCGDVGPSE